MVKNLKKLVAGLAMGLCLCGINAAGCTVQFPDTCSSIGAECNDAMDPLSIPSAGQAALKVVAIS